MPNGTRVISHSFIRDSLYSHTSRIAPIQIEENPWGVLKTRGTDHCCYPSPNLFLW